MAPASLQTLILVPTALELAGLRDAGGLGVASAQVELCGFGPVAAAARSAALLEALRPERVLLVGIAGTHDAGQAPLGAAVEFDRVRLEGVGAGEGPGLLGPEELGFPQWPGAPDTPDEAITDLLELAAPSGAGTLLTVCAASGDAAHAALRRERVPDAVGEDMEGFGVALACRLANRPLRIVRGVSNRAGDRDHRSWCVAEALAAAAARVRELLGEEGDWR